MKNVLSRVAVASTLFLQTVFMPSYSVAGPILSNLTTGFHYVGNGGDKTLPADFFAAQGYTLLPLTNNQISNSLAFLDPNITIGGVDSNRFIVPTLANSPCRSGCSLVLDFAALQSAVGPGVAIDGVAMVMFQLGTLNEGFVNFTQGIESEFVPMSFFLQDQYTGQYGLAEFANPSLSGLRARMSFSVGNSGLSRGMEGQFLIAQKNTVNAVPEPGSLTLAGVGIAALIVVSGGSLMLAVVPIAALGGIDYAKQNPQLFNSATAKLKAMFSRTKVQARGELKGLPGLKARTAAARPSQK